MSSRRKFIRNLALLSVTAALAPRGSAAMASAVLRSTPAVARDPLALASFAPLQGRAFSVQGEDGARHIWRLAEIAQSAGGGTVENFSLQFAAAAPAAVRDGIYRVSHPELGDVDLFVVAQQRGENATYRAVISRLV